MAQVCNVIKKESLVQVISCEFCEIPKNTFLTEDLLELRKLGVFPLKLNSHKSSFLIKTTTMSKLTEEHCVKSVQIRSIFWPLFLVIKIREIKL